MTASKTISPEALLWAEMFVLWAITSYGIAADPLKDGTQKVRWTWWGAWLVVRIVLAGALSYLLSGSIFLSIFLILVVLFQPLVRSWLSMRWVAELECAWVMAFVGVSAGYIQNSHLLSRWRPGVLADARTGALCIAVGIFIFIIRGGTYIVRGILRKAGTLPSQKERVWEEVVSVGLAASTSQNSPPSAPAVRQDVIAADLDVVVDVEELNRGRLIGNLERIVLTIVVAAGSYSALGFLVAAKGLVRFEEFEKSREFTEYFLVGSLSSVLIALCAGLILRHALLLLWPELLILQMQS